MDDTTEWLTCDPAGVAPDVLHARIMSGEDLDEDDPAEIRRTCDLVRRAQEDLRSHVETTEDGRIRVWRAVDVAAAELNGIVAAHAAGEAWSFDRAGAHPYDGRSRETVVFEALVSPEDVEWPTTLAAWPSGEGEARLDVRGMVEIVAVTTKAGVALAPHLAGEEVALSSPRPGRQPSGPR